MAYRVSQEHLATRALMEHQVLVVHRVLAASPATRVLTEHRAIQVSVDGVVHQVSVDGVEIAVTLATQE